MKFTVFALAALLVSCTSPRRVVRSPESPNVLDVERKTVALVRSKDNGEARAYCSGVWVGWNEILTAAHCLDDEDIGDSVDYLTRGDLREGLGNSVKTIRSARLIDRDAEHDLALLSTSIPPTHLVAVVASEAPYVGEYVQTEGHSLGLWYSYSRGEVSGIRQIDLEGFSPYMWWIQEDAPVSPGNSGGGLFNERGELLGICHGYFPRGQLLNIYVHTMYVNAFLERQGA
jgi:S1-C subfamily serine protease